MSLWVAPSQILLPNSTFAPGFAALDDTEETIIGAENLVLIGNSTSADDVFVELSDGGGQERGLRVHFCCSRCQATVAAALRFSTIKIGKIARRWALTVKRLMPSTPATSSLVLPHETQ